MSARLEAEEREAIAFIIDLVYSRSRIRLHEGKEALIRARLGKRLRYFGMKSLAEYCRFLRAGTEPDEPTKVVDALATNFTHFMREEDHFQFMVQEALPKMLGTRPQKFQVWSAACATGEEPYTIAFFLEEHFPVSAGWNWQVTATDISTKALDKARQGIYAADRLEKLPSHWLRKYFQKGFGEADGWYRIKSALRERINFQQVNLLADYHWPGPFELVFCRNVMIYFDRQSQEALVRRMCQFMRPQAHLLVGHSESLNGLTLPLRCLRPSYYQHIP